MARPNPAVQTTVDQQQEGADITDDGGFIANGSTEPPLQDLTTGQLLQQQLDRHPAKLAVTSRWQQIRLTYQSLFDSSREIAQALLVHGVRPSDRVAVLAGNSVEYVQLFFAAGGIGSVFTIINPTFTAEEAVAAVDFIGKAFRPRMDPSLIQASQPPRPFLLPTESGTATRKAFCTSLRPDTTTHRSLCNWEHLQIYRAMFFSLGTSFAVWRPAIPSAACIP